MSNYILIDYSSIKPGSLSAIGYPTPFTAIVFFPKSVPVAVSDVIWLAGAGISTQYVPVSQGGMIPISMLIASYLGVLSKTPNVQEVLVLSPSAHLDTIITTSVSNITVKRFNMIAALPVIPGGPPQMSPLIKAQRLTVVASIVVAVFISFLVWFYCFLRGYGGPTGKALVYDFGAYALPGIGAILAGLGLFFRKKETVLYLFSAFFAILGFICYIFSKRELMSVIHGYPEFFVAATFWGVLGSFVGIACMGLFFLDRVTLGSWRQLSQLNRWYKVRRVSYVVFAVLMGTSMCILIGMFINITAHPNSWTAEGPFHELYQTISAWLAR